MANLDCFTSLLIVQLTATKNSSSSATWFTIKNIIIMELAIVQRIVSFVSDSVLPVALMPWVINIIVGINVKLKT
jgi:hypothetical protein